MSGSTGNARIEGRDTFEFIVTEYKKIISDFVGLVNIGPTGSYNSDKTKTSFGDIDLILQIDYTKNKKLVRNVAAAVASEAKRKNPKSDENIIKSQIKQALIEFLTDLPESVIVPFAPGPNGKNKYAGKRANNTGEIVTVSFKAGAKIPAAQIDNIIALNSNEYEFKKQFLDLPANIQGLVIGLVKTAITENKAKKIFDLLGIKINSTLPIGQEYEFNLSSKALTLRKIKYDVNDYIRGIYTEVSRETIESWTDFSIVRKLIDLDLSLSFEELVRIADKKLKNPRSRKRLVGIFKTMITVKSGEIGTSKGKSKEYARQLIEQTFSVKGQ